MAFSRPLIDQALVDAVAAELAARRRPFCKAIHALRRAAIALGAATTSECVRMLDEQALLADALESLFDRMAAMVRRRERLCGQGNFGDDADDAPPAHPKFVEVGLIGGLTGVAGAVLRPAQADDVDPLVGLSRRAWLSAFERTAPRAWRDYRAVAGIEEQICGRDFAHMLVLDAGNGLLGLVQPKGDEIDGLWVEPQHQGHGAGARLLAAAEQRIRDAGHHRAWLVCNACNERALAFYRRHGYAETARTAFRHECGAELVDVRLERVL